MSPNKSCIILLFILLSLTLGPPALSAEDSGISSLRQTSKAFASVAKKVSPSVVFVNVESVQKSAAAAPFVSPFSSPFNDDFFKRFFGESFPGLTPREAPRQAPPQERKIMGQGSGFVFSHTKGLLSETTYILTNNHVVEGADKIHITAQDGREFEATLTGADPKSDLAVLEIKAALPKLEMGDSSALEVGEWVLAIGNPFGLSHTLTVGVVSAKGRTGLGINDYEDFIQTDAAINPGNSGGPLVNLNGEVIGVNTAIFSRSGGYMGVGFAIPANLARGVAEQLIANGEVTRGYLGIVIQQLTPELAESFSIKQGKGILVAQVSEGSPAEKAGIKTGDLIVRYQDQAVETVGDFRNRVALTPPGSKATVSIIRNGQGKDIAVKIGKLSDAEIVAQAPASAQAPDLGLTVQTLSPELAQQFDVKPGQGVVVTEVQPASMASLAGIRPGMVILEVNRKTVNSAAEFRQAVDKSRGDKRVLLLVSDRGMSRFVVLRWR
ncbi:MAG: DegQ family serine endoprotease [Gammaproteobacteria bacterium]|nr:DegQ family serine endoprotease [Gammaproteobacteria bacterium]